ncbi:efflux transporter outer membrane subunit [Aurantiacibacter xanthus]|uniref:Efflux transporter outer membrane subunit n=1 Tax=Aurantiacibacter xanthus TaxID=1784712 RepID=A0A3A1P6U9_9SPHN|nr:efflux transporter outer membrane subunit [Aurantiacibacter xanthus]RIV89543.1 efflux transporter outer membrane subunit [Aurantiacibacter xanthus]
MTRRLITIALLGTALTGCVNLAPDHVRPELANASDTAWEADLRPDGTLVASTLAWQDYFVDPRLQALISTGLANNRDLIAATARIDQARAQYRIQDAERLPDLNATGSVTDSRSRFFGAPGSPTTIETTNYNLGVAVPAFELDFWGRVANLSEAARARYLATEAAQRAFYLSLIGNIASTYFQIAETDQQIALAEATAESRRDALRIENLRLEAGVESGLSSEQARSLLTTAEQQLASQRQNAATLRNRLRVLVGGRIPGELPEGLPLTAQVNTVPLAAGLPSDLLLARPDIVQAEHELRAARANIGAARAAFFPSISLTGNAGYASTDLSDLFDSSGFGWSFGPSISLPIFDNGGRQANLDYARALEVEEVANYDKTVQTAFQEVADALAGRRWIAEQISAQQRNIVALEQIAHIARVRYREGVAEYLEVLDAERSLFSARQTLLATERAADQNAASLYIALGGGMLSEAPRD